MQSAKFSNRFQDMKFSDICHRLDEEIIDIGVEKEISTAILDHIPARYVRFKVSQ
jgi:hypothetical protein